MEIDFGHASNMYRDPETREVRLRATINGRDTLWRISEETITDHFDDPSGDDVLGTAKRHFDQLTDALGMKTSHGGFEDDGSVLLRTQEYPQFRPR